MSRQIVILAAGKGTRMGVDMPKVLLPIKDRPVIKQLLDSVKYVEQDSAPVIVVGFQKEKVLSALGNEYIYAEQFDQKGTGHAALSAKDKVTAENIIVLNGDMPFITADTLNQMADQHISNNATVTMLTCKLPNFDGDYANLFSYGRIIRNEDGSIQKIQEVKDCTEEQKQISEVNTGEYMFSTSWLWDKLALIGDNNAQHEFYLTDIVEIAIKDGQKVQSVSVQPEEVYGINTPDNLAFAKTLIYKT